MHFKYTTAVFLATLIGARGAAITSHNRTSQLEQEPGQTLVLLSSASVPAGNLTMWGVPDDGITAATDSADSADPAVNRRCGSNQVICHGNHRAYKDVCIALIGTLNGAGLGIRPKSICLTQTESRCCISWSLDVQGLIQNELYSGATAALDACGSSGLVSAVVHDTNLRGICTNQCLSNRPKKCP